MVVGLQGILHGRAARFSKPFLRWVRPEYVLVGDGIIDVLVPICDPSGNVQPGRYFVTCISDLWVEAKREP